MYDLITIGSSLIDIFVKSQDFMLQKTDRNVMLCQTLGDKVEVDEFVLRTGGGGTNTAVGFARMGFNTAVITETGKDQWSNIILSELHQEFVSANLVVREKHEKTGTSVILVSPSGGRTALVFRGAASQLDPHDIPDKYFAHTKWVHLTSISNRLQTLSKIFDLASQNKSLRMSWNPGKKEIMLIAEGRLSVSLLPIEVLIVNEEEWALLESSQRVLMEKTRHIVVTNGHHGGRVYFDGDWHNYSTNKIESLDDTGAGDSFAVGYVSAVLYDKDLETAIAWGKKNAQSVIQQVGAKPGLLKKSEFFSAGSVSV